MSVCVGIRKISGFGALTWSNNAWVSSISIHPTSAEKRGEMCVSHINTFKKKIQLKNLIQYHTLHQNKIQDTYICISLIHWSDHYWVQKQPKPPFLKSIILILTDLKQIHSLSHFFSLLLDHFIHPWSSQSGARRVLLLCLQWQGKFGCCNRDWYHLLFSTHIYIAICATGSRWGYCQINNHVSYVCITLLFWHRRPGQEKKHNNIVFMSYWKSVLLLTQKHLIRYSVLSITV